MFDMNSDRHYKQKHNTLLTALNAFKIKLIPSTTHCAGEINTLSNTGPHKVPYVLSIPQYGHR
jgi:hypothetical protein